MKILLATQNKHKVDEISRLLKPYAIDVASLLDYPELGEIVEDGDSLEANALIKAKAGYTHCGLPTLSDDTGLFVDALDGAPGIYAARYAGEQATYDDNVEKMLGAMKTVPEGKRQAQFQTVAVFYDGKTSISAAGVVEGNISLSRQGNSGFGYDPIFIVDDTQKTYAQMDISEKNRLSHRKRAFESLLIKLNHTHQAFKVGLR